jgi:GDP-L-fucose synthase
MLEVQTRCYRAQYGHNFVCVIPTNIYGPHDNFHLEDAHVIPALIRRFHEAKLANAPSVAIWGTGTPRREFLYVDDMAAASVHVLELPVEVYRAHTQTMCSHINVGTGIDCTIRELAETIARVTGFTGQLVWDASKPDGAPRKLLEVSRLRQLGWQASITLENGLRDAYGWYLAHLDEARL